jgi:Stress responsive A/B Barrel Domain
VIRHAALFRLIHTPGSAAEADFLAALASLGSIPNVENFDIAREVSTKNEFAFAVSMTFADQAAYDSYNAHPDHLAFVQGRWLPEIASFMEHDTVDLAPV